LDRTQQRRGKRLQEYFQEVRLVLEGRQLQKGVGIRKWKIVEVPHMRFQLNVNDL
jgi:hypothetical protein